ncbi:MAG: aromatic ring-hydroxylating dioxygenase subunit alpha, partial [Allosphingosinicella sp.]
GGVVTCGYHGLAFGPTGACVRNPHGPVTSSMRVRAFAVAERHSILWIWMGDPAQADPSKIADLSFIDETPETARIRFYMPTAANYQLLVDNIMDLSHADYLHPTTLGGIMTGSSATSREHGDRVVAEWLSQGCEPPPAFRPMVPSGLADIWTEVVWSPPALMVLGTAAKPAGVPRTRDDEAYTLHNMVPETETTTHYFVCSTRRFLLDDAGFSAMLHQALVRAFTEEDKPMLEKQQAQMGTTDLWALGPILLKVDAAAVRVRRKLDKLIELESAPGLAVA